MTAAPDLLDRVYSAALRMTGSLAAAADLVEETYARAYAPNGRIPADVPLRNWLFRTLVDTRCHVGGGTAQTEKREHARAGRPSPTGRHGADARALEALPDAQVKAVLQSLPEDFRIAVHLADVEEFTHQEIADILGTSVDAVNSCLRRGRRQLRGLLEDRARQREPVRQGTGS
jgi:RNA polymerase sigma-70 factor (ECF subfamily)